MLERQRLGLVEGCAKLIDSGNVSAADIEHQRVLWGATCEEVVESLHNIDTAIALAYDAWCKEEEKEEDQA